MQNEMNLHNLNTKLSEQLYYLGAFLLLVVLPVVYKMCKRALGWLRLSSLAVFLPAVWLPVSFAVTFGFIGAGRMVWPYVFWHDDCCTSVTWCIPGESGAIKGEKYRQVVSNRYY